jgi:hypothetical protein
MASPFTAGGVSNAVTGTANVTAVMTFPAYTVGDLAVSVCCYSGVAAGSGPFITQTNSGGFGWSRIFYQAPSGTGNAVEIVLGYISSGLVLQWNFNAVVTYGCRFQFYTNSRRTNDYADNYGNGTADVSVGNYLVDSARATGSQITGSNPSTATRYSRVDELVLAVGANQLASPGYGAAGGGFTKRLDNTLSGFGTTEYVLADLEVATEGNVSCPFTATASPAGQLGVMGIFGLAPPPRRYPAVAAGLPAFL